MCSVSAARSPQFKEEEVKVLLDSISANRHVLFGSFSKDITKERKEEVWEEIVTKMNASSATRRHVKNVKKKWSDFASRAKVKRLKFKKQRSGDNKPLKDLTELEKLALDIIGETAVDGIEGGIDSMDANISHDAGNTEHHDDDDANPESDGNTVCNYNVASSDDELTTAGTSNYSACTETLPRTSKSKTKKPIPASEQLLTVEKEKLALLRERVSLARQTLKVQSNIAFYLERIENALQNIANIPSFADSGNSNTPDMSLQLQDIPSYTQL